MQKVKLTPQLTVLDLLKFKTSDNLISFPVDTRRRFNVYTTSIRRNDVV